MSEENDDEEKASLDKWLDRSAKVTAIVVGSLTVLDKLGLI
ncbi:hypothetical protein [Halogeometricum borinquense]|nr:hypothetical protein [Halogeometricum borinquense]